MTPMRPETTSNISLGDVEAHLRAIESEHCCNCTISLVMPSVGGTSVLFWVRASAEPRLVGRKTVRGPAMVSRRWPHVDHRTLAGLMVELCYELSAMLETQGHVPAEQASFGW